MSKSTHSIQREHQTRVITVAGYDPAKFAGVEFQWWQNPTNPNSLRLTTVGYKWFTGVARLRAYEIKLPKEQKILPKQLLQLERLFTEPYFIRSLRNILVFGEQDAIMLQLHAGNLADYLNNLEDNK